MSEVYLRLEYATLDLVTILCVLLFGASGYKSSLEPVAEITIGGVLLKGEFCTEAV